MKIVTAQGHMFSGGPGSSDEYAAMAQGRLLQMFKTSRSEYSVVFTTGLNASYRLVANSYPFQKGSPILVCQDIHDSANQVQSHTFIISCSIFSVIRCSIQIDQELD